MNMNSPLNEFLKTNPSLREEIISTLAGGSTCTLEQRGGRAISEV